MNVPADIPSSDQENVYYSVNSLIQELSNFFETSFLDGIRAEFAEYTLPTFVLNTDNAPNTYEIDVYPRGGNKFNVALDSNGAFSNTNKVEIPQVTAPVGRNLQDEGGNVELDPSFYANTKLKSKDFFTSVAIDEEAENGLETILATKFWLDKNLLEERGQYLEFIINLVKNTLESLPEKDYEELKKTYTKMDKDIDSILQTLTDIRDGETISVGSLMPNKLYEIAYPQITPRSNSVNLTKLQFAKSLSDLNNSRTNSQGKYKKGFVYASVTGSSPQVALPTQKNYSETTYRKVWNKFIDTLITEGHIEDQRIPDLGGNSVNYLHDMGADINSLLTFSDGGVEKETFANKGWLSEWYFDNFAKILTGEELNFDSLNSFLDSYASTLDKVENVAKLSTTGGNFLLVMQAIKKAILKICQSNLDVTEHAPTKGSTDIFALMGRSSVLGPAGCHQAPSKASTSTEDYTIDNFTKTGFLCYHALLKIIDKAWDYTATKNFLLENIVEYDSDHDRVLQMWDDISEYGFHSKQTVGVQSYINNAGGRSAKRVAEKDIKVAHLYKINESFNSTEIYLVPAGDDKTGKSERTFVGYNLRGIDHTRESDITQNDSIYLAEGYGLKPLSDDDSSAVGSEGRLSVWGAPAAYKLMGYKVSVSRVMVGGTTSASAPSYSRSERVHYGYINPSNWDSSNQNNDSYDFWRQKNYNLPYFWASMVSLFRTITIDTYKNLITSVNEITGLNIELTTREILDLFDHGLLWNAINTVVYNLIKSNGIKQNCFVRVDGTIGFTDDVSGEDLKRMWQIEYRNTSGDNNGKLLKNYARFASSVSQNNSIKIVDQHEEIEFDYATYLPPEGMAINANNNYKNVHGGFNAYVSDQFQKYYDPLEFRSIEFLDGRAMNKTKNAIDTDTTFLNQYTAYVETSKEMFQHSLFHKEIRKAFENLQVFIEGFAISDTAIDIFSEGGMDVKNDIQNPNLLMDQIKNNRAKHSANSDGIANRWNNLFFENPIGFVEDSKSWIYCYVLGLKRSSFNSQGKISIVPEYVGSSDIVRLSNLTKTFDLVPAATVSGDELDSANVLKYFHLVRGIDITETTFSAENDLIYEPIVIENESGVFPWVADQFEEGKPKEKIDNVFTISPFVFPKNYFNNVCMQNDFARVVGIVIKSNDLNEYDDVIDTIDQNNVIKEIIGSIRFVVLEE